MLTAAVSPAVMATELRRGLRLEMPLGLACAAAAYALMQQCWDMTPKHRPKFTALTRALEQLKASGPSRRAVPRLSRAAAPPAWRLPQLDPVLVGESAADAPGDVAAMAPPVVEPARQPTVRFVNPSGARVARARVLLTAAGYVMLSPHAKTPNTTMPPSPLCMVAAVWSHRR